VGANGAKSKAQSTLVEGLVALLSDGGFNSPRLHHTYKYIAAVRRFFIFRHNTRGQLSSAKLKLSIMSLEKEGTKLLLLPHEVRQ